MEKTLRMNLLFDFYGPLLTERQRDVFRMYFQYDLSLGEIGEQLEVSRQAIYDLLRRVQVSLEDFEDKLRLVERHEERQTLYQELLVFLEKLPDATDPDRTALAKIKEKIRQAQGGMD